MQSKTNKMLRRLSEIPKKPIKNKDIVKNKKKERDVSMFVYKSYKPVKTKQNTGRKQNERN
jgi:hypothetical protein